MKIIASTAAGLLAASALAPTPATAQRYGWNGGWGGGGGWHGDRGWRGGWDRGWRGGYRGGWGYRPRSRVVCQLVPGYWGPVRQCFRAWR